MDICNGKAAAIALYISDSPLINKHFEGEGANTLQGMFPQYHSYSQCCNRLVFSAATIFSPCL